MIFLSYSISVIAEKTFKLEEQRSLLKMMKMECCGKLGKYIGKKANSSGFDHIWLLVQSAPCKEANLLDLPLALPGLWWSTRIHLSHSPAPLLPPPLLGFSYHLFEGYILLYGWQLHAAQMASRKELTNSDQIRVTNSKPPFAKPLQCVKCCVW